MTTRLDARLLKALEGRPFWLDRERLTFVRSDFFATIVLADAHLAAGEVEQACIVAIKALTAGEQIRSA